MEDSIGAVEQALEAAARSCLRLIVTQSLTPAQNRRLAKWMFGCLNQRYTIRQRIAERGNGELAKVMEFVARACEAMLEIDEDS